MILMRMLLPPVLRNCCGTQSHDGDDCDDVPAEPASSTCKPVSTPHAGAAMHAAAFDATAAIDLLDMEMLAMILSHCEQPELLSARVVCRQWKQVADEAALGRFKRDWCLSSLSGKPKSPAFLQTLKRDAFVKQRKTCALDSLSSLAIASGSDVQRLKQTNNLYNEHSLASREHVFCPVEDPRGVAGEFVYDPIVGRQFVVVERDDSATAMPPQLDAIAQKQREEQAFEKLVQLLSRSLRIDMHQAAFYLHSSKGDMRGAMTLHSQDVDWERAHRRRL